MSEKKRELADWERAECHALKLAVDAFNAGKNRSESLTQGKIAERLDISQGSVSSYLNGYNALNMRVAGAIAGMIGIPVDQFSARLAKEISQVSLSAMLGHKSGALTEAYISGKATALRDIATPRSRAVLERINQAAIDGRLSEADLDLLDQIATRFESRGQPPVSGGEGSHKRLRNKLQNDDPHPQK